jgi:hypothetical protein
MTADELQAGADWVYSRFYSLDQIFLRFVRNMLAFRWMPALLGLKLGMTYRHDNIRENIRGWNPLKSRRACIMNGGWNAHDFAQD